MKIGYARVSTHEPNLDLQLGSLKEIGCEQVFKDKLSGSKAKRPGLGELKHILSLYKSKELLLGFKRQRKSKNNPNPPGLTKEQKEWNKNVEILK